MHNFVHDMLHGSPAALRIEALWKARFLRDIYASLMSSKEYEAGETREACFVKGVSNPGVP